MNAARLAILHYKVAMMYEAQYRVNFFVQIVHSLVQLATGLIAIALVFQYTSDLGGWTRPELLAIMGVHILLGGIVATFVQPAMREVMHQVAQGEFDYVLVRPVDPQFMVSIRKIAIWHLTDVVVGALVILWALTETGGAAGWFGAIGFVVTISCGAVIMYSLWLAMTSTSFKLVRVSEITQLIDGLYQTGRWPVGIYPGWLRGVLTFVVPLAFAVTVPAGALTDRLTGPTLAGAVVAAVIAFIATRLVWKWQLRNYSGASS